MTAPSRLNWGCGPRPVPGWINADRQFVEGLQLCGDIGDGLALADSCIDYAVAIHVLQDLAWTDIGGALAELRRVLRPGGVLRLGLPDLDRAIDAYRRNDGRYFYVPDEDARSTGAKLVTQIIWYGSVRTPFNFAFAEEVLQRAGFQHVVRCDFGRSASHWPDIASLDNRPRESLFVEARA
jgi:SAM-dependent methyltransferase